MVWKGAWKLNGAARNSSTSTQAPLTSRYVALGILLNRLNSSMIAVALARLQQDFHLTFADASWLISTYYLASAIGQPVMGKISDLWGRLYYNGYIL